MAISRACWVVTLFLIVTTIEGKNVVFLPMEATSHARIHAFVAVELAKMGHNVWVALSAALHKGNAESYPGVTIFTYDTYSELSEDQLISDIESTITDAITNGTDPDWSWLKLLQSHVSKTYFKAMSKGHLIDYIESMNPDLIVLEGFPDADERVAISYKLKVPFALLTTLFAQTPLRMPLNPVAEAYNSNYIRTQANVFEKAITIMKMMSLRILHLFNDRGYMKQLFPADPDVTAANELFSQAEIYLLESDPLNDYPRPTVPNVKLIGGICAGPAKELSEPFKSFIERSEKAGVGVAVLSFGSLCMNLPKEGERKIVEALKRLKLNTIWRANMTSPDPDKILTSTWIPQNDLLGNKNVQVFITHAGAHSIYEALYYAVLAVCVPLFYDQQYNADRAVDKGHCLWISSRSPLMSWSRLGYRAGDRQQRNEVDSQQGLGNFIGICTRIPKRKQRFGLITLWRIVYEIQRSKNTHDTLRSRLHYNLLCRCSLYFNCDTNYLSYHTFDSIQLEEERAREERVNLRM